MQASILDHDLNTECTEFALSLTHLVGQYQQHPVF